MLEVEGGGAAGPPASQLSVPSETAARAQAVHLALAALALTCWLVSRRHGTGSFRNWFGGTRTDSTAVACALRVGLASLAAAWAPVCSLLLPGAPIWLSAEALLLSALPLLLPLPLKHHLWCQGLALRSVLARMQQLAGQQAAHPQQAAQCVRFARGARLALLAFVPGGLEPQPGPPAQHACWMVNVWSTAVLGLLLPAAVLAALAQHARWWQHLRQYGQLQPQAGGASQPLSAGALTSEPHTPTAPELTDADARLSGSSGGGTPVDSSSPSSVTLLSMLPPGRSDPETSPSTTHASIAEGIPYSSIPGPFTCPPYLAWLLCQWLLLLLPAGALVWAALEVGLQLGG